MVKEVLFKIRINVQQERELDRLKKRMDELIALRKKNNGLTAKESVELASVRKNYNLLTGQIVKQNQVRRTEANTLGRINAQLAIEKQRIRDVVIGSKDFDKVAARIKNLENKQRAANAAMGRGSSFVGEYARGAVAAFRQISVGILAVVVALRTVNRVFKDVISTLEEFEEGQTNVQTLLEDFDDQLRDETIFLMRKYGLTINDTNRALFDAVSAGVAVRDTFGFMNEAAILAIAGVSDMESVVDGMTTVMNVWNLSLGEMSKVSAAFFSAQKKGKFYISDITSEIGKVAAIAKIADVSYQKLMTTYAILTARGLSVTDATTAIKSTLLAITKPSEKAKKAFKDMRIETGLTAVAEQGLFNILTKINTATKIQKDKLTELVPNVRALTGVAILNEEAMKEWHKVLKIVTEDFGEGSSIMKGYTLQMEKLKKEKELLKSAWDALILSSKEGNAIGRAWGKILLGLTNATDALRIVSERSTTGNRKQRIETFLLAEEEKKLAAQRAKSERELTTWMNELKMMEEDAARRKEADEEARIQSVADEKKDFEDRLKRIKLEGDVERAMGEEDQAVADAEFERLMMEHETEKQLDEEKRLRRERMDAEIQSSMEETANAVLESNQKQWKSDEERFKRLQESYKKTVGVFEGVGAQLVQMTNDAIVQGELDLKKFAKISLAIALDTLQKIILMKRAEILAKALASPESIATFGAAGVAKFAIINTLITTAFQAAKAVLTANKGMIVPGKGNKDTVPALLTPDEGIINARSMRSGDIMTLSGTPYEIASRLNSYKGFGIPFAAGGVAGSTTNNTYNNIDESTIDRLISGINARNIRVIQNVNEVTSAQEEINVIQETSEI